ncbi:MAG TPA: PilZ domain-containing protein [Terriglobales bacterium]|nr:PilZ domain-containing protein [Terriglobales bacterium]
MDWSRSQESEQVSPERRCFERYDLDTELTARLSFDGPAIMRGYSLDISINGIAGVFVTGWEVGTHVWLEFSLPTWTGRIQMQAVVRNRSGYRYGFEFVNLSGRDRLLIQKTCRVLSLLG